jgi:hypothetical protein
MITTIKKKFQRELKLLNIQYKNFEKIPPILVYQSGKVGSSTVVDSLKALRLKNPVYHLHYLSHELLAKEGIGKLRFSKALRSKIDSYKNIEDINWKIITLTRDPIAIAISSLFQNIGINQQENISSNNNEMDISAIFEHLENNLKSFRESEFCLWFDRELKIVFNIDVFDYPFDCDLGYSIIKQGNIELLIIRLENLNSSGGQALSTFLNLPEPVPIISSNVGSKKKYRDTYKFVKDNLTVDSQVCNLIYSSNYVQHFYSKQQIAEFTDKWSKKIAK